MNEPRPKTPKPPPLTRRKVTLCGSEAPQPGHICAFFNSADEKYAALAPFFNDAIDAGDCVVNIVDADRRDQHLRSLSSARVPVEPAMQMDRLRVMTTEETYVRDGELNLDGVLDLVRETLAMAEREGRSVRTCGEMDWIGRTPTALARAMEYEARVNYLLAGCDCTLLCVYDLARIPSGVVADIMATHEYAVLNGRLRRNPYFIQPDEYLEMIRSRVI